MNTKSYFKFLLWSLYGAPLWWVLGFNLFIYHLIAFALFFTLTFQLTRENRGIYLPPSSVWLLIICVIYAFSLAVHAPSSEPSRVVASAYNLSFWVMGWMLTVAMGNLFTRAHIKPLLTVFLWIAGVTGLLAVIVLLAAVSGRHQITIPTLFSKPLLALLGNTPLIENSLILKLLHYDWLTSGSFPRFMAFCPYATATGSFILILLMMIVAWADAHKKIRNPFFWIIFAGAFLALIMTLSRTSVIAFAVGFAYGYLLQRKRSWIWLFLGTTAVLVLGSGLGQMMEWVLHLRQDSTVGRVKLYQYTLDMLEGIDWVIGFGLKPRDESAFLVPVGSHSTYLSLLFKTGVAGGGAFILFQAHLLLRWIAARRIAFRHRALFSFWRSLGGVFLGIILWMFTEDLDGPQILAFLYFLLIGAFEGCLRDEKQRVEAIENRPSGEQQYEILLSGRVP